MYAKTKLKKNIVNAKRYNETCYIIGGGPSLTDFDWSLIDTDKKFVIAINRSYEVLPRAKIIYFTDPDFWERHKVAMRKHGGLMLRGGLHVDVWYNSELRQQIQPMNRSNPQYATLCDDSINGHDMYEFHLTGYESFDERWGYLRHGKNSAYAAMNLAIAHFKFKKVYLLGLDMGWKDGVTHWHDGHERIDPENIYKVMRNAYASSVPMVRKYKADVVNVNTHNTLPMFKFMDLETFKERNTK